MITYEQCEAIANTAHGSAVEGSEIEAFSRAYMRGALVLAYTHLAPFARRGAYDPVYAWKAWQYVADRVELAYSAVALTPGMPGFKPAKVHAIDKDGRRMAAYYMERRWRADVFRVAGVPVPAELIAGCDPEEV